MPWLLVDLLVALLALVFLGLCLLGLYRRLRVLGRAVGTASERVGALTGELESLQAQAAVRRPTA